MTDFGKYKNIYLDLLQNQVMPFWLKHSEDESGAINNCLSENGKLLSRDRYIWSQGRALYTYSALYNKIEKNTEYLKRADGLFNYLLGIGASDNGTWNYLYDGDGNLKEGDVSIYVDSFVLAGMTEYYKATKNEKAKEIAIAAYENTKRRIEAPGSYKVLPYVIPTGMKTHGVNMVFSFFYTELGRATGRADIKKAGYQLAIEVLEQFYVKEKDAILEFVTLDGKFLDTPEGRVCVPGHAIECMWFLINIFEELGESERISKCCKIIKRHIGLAKTDIGGLRLALDIDGKEPCFWNKPNYMPWWVQLEALVATAYAYKHTHDEWFMKEHEKLLSFALSHYPSGSGEWYNWLDHNGKVGESAALPVKDPFHMPRAFMYLIQLFGELE